MTGNILIDRANTLRDLGEKILNETNIRNDLSKYGQVIISGSYKYNLMTQPDIDIYLINPKVKETAKRVIDMVIDKEIFKFALFQNMIAKTKPQLPFGFYIGLNKKIEEEKFNVDIWIVKDKEAYTSKYSEDEQKLVSYLEEGLVTKEQKGAILLLKQYRSENNIDVKSFTIYDMVINHDVRDVGGFLELKIV